MERYQGRDFMINPISNQNYPNLYVTAQAAQPAGNVPIALQPSDGSPVVAGTPDVKKNQEIGPKECKTCHARRYKDQSNDASVSFQTPTYVAPELAASAVAAHEQEHVQHNAQKAQSEGMKATSFVQIHTAICPECGRIYVSGGTTETHYSKKQQTPGEDGNGLFVDIKA
jgi:hypothetical protein